MALKIGREPVYVFPCDIKWPNERIPGQFVSTRVNVTFRALELSASRAMLDKAAADGSHDLDKQILRDVIVNWDEGFEEPFGPEILEVALDNPWIKSGLMDGYKKSVSGEAVQTFKRKN